MNFFEMQSNIIIVINFGQIMKVGLNPKSNHIDDRKLHRTFTFECGFTMRSVIVPFNISIKAFNQMSKVAKSINRLVS